MSQRQKYPHGWDEARIKKVLDYYENQTDEEAAAEIEEAMNSPHLTAMMIPVSLVPAVRRLLARHAAPTVG